MHASRAHFAGAGAVSSAVEHCSHTAGATGSIPVPPTNLSMDNLNLSSLRSALFVPLADERFLAKAHERGADALLLDLEDSVPPAQKAAARARMPGAARQLAAAGATVMLRVNSAPEHLAPDLKAAAQLPLAAVFLPKVENAEQIAAAQF